MSLLKQTTVSPLTAGGVIQQNNIYEKYCKIQLGQISPDTRLKYIFSERVGCDGTLFAFSNFTIVKKEE